jgi:acyl-CoA synthetase (AMP-forming)/AMP-acid ligase II
LRDGETVRWTYDDLGREAGAIARALIAAGVEPGDTVAIVMGNRPEAVAALFGTAMAGAVSALVSTFAPKPELEVLLRRSGATLALAQPALRARRFDDDLDELLPDLPALEQVAILGEPSWTGLLSGVGEVTEGDLRERIDITTPDDPAVVIFSSGTTSEPKGILLGHRSPSLQFWLQADLFGRTPKTRMFSALPIFWSAGLTAMGSTLAAGGCWVMQEIFEPGATLALLAREAVTEPYTLPHQTTALAEHPDWASTDLSALTCVYGKSAFARHPSVHGDTGWIMPVGYGLSETCSFAASYRSDTVREQARIGVGHLLPGTRLRVIDPESGRALGTDEEGELALAGCTRMLRYLGKPRAETFDADGFFHTGDAGHVDADGIVHYSGRMTEVIRTAGANVSPAEVETALRACPGVKLSRIIGMPDPRLDQVVVACIIPADGAELTTDDVTGFLRQRIAPYKVPKHVLFFADGEIPMTGSATKVRDEELRELVHDRLAAVRAATTTAPTPSGDR